MGKDLDINSKIQNYIQELSKSLHPVQSEIIFYNKGLGDIKKMQIAISQCYFLELITKTSHAKKILEIGTFTGLSTLSMALGLPDDGTLIALDKNAETNLKAKAYFKKAKQNKKIKTIIKPALESLKELKNDNLIFDIIFIDADKDNYKNYYDNAYEMIKPGGLIAGHDYTMGNWLLGTKYGVIEAVTEFCVTKGWKFVYLTADYTENCSFVITRIK